jgi:molybdopterin/thiamine biosynthesis adenylyltransferase
MTTSWDRVERLIGSDNLERLASQRVAIVGLGSGGGFVALSLAMSGVGHFVLIDDDNLEDTNIVRHVGDSRFLGRPKAEVVAELIRYRNPQAQIEIRVGKVEHNLDALENIDLLVSGVDGEGPKYTLNQLCLERNLTAVYAGVYERGIGGDVVVIRPGKGPCYACWAAELREGLVTPAPGKENEELDYGMIGPEGTIAAEPGLWLHVTRIASSQADLVLNELLRGTSAYRAMPANTVIIANTNLEILTGQISPPYTAVWVNIERDPDCFVCGDKLRHQLAGESAEVGVTLDELMSSTGIELEEEEAGDSESL